MHKVIYAISVIILLTYFGFSYYDFAYRINIFKYSIFSSLLSIGIILHIVWLEYFFKNILKLKTQLIFSLLYYLGIIAIISLPIFYREGLNSWGAPINIHLIKSVFSNLQNIISILLTKRTILGVSLLLIIIILARIPIFRFRKETLNKKIQSSRFMSLSLIYILIVGLFASQGFFLSEERIDIFKNNEVYTSFFSKSPQERRVKQLHWKQLEQLEEIVPIEKYKKKNVILISVDCLRPDFIGLKTIVKPSITPFLDSLSMSIHYYKVNQAYSTCNSSFGGILSMLNSMDLSNLGNVKIGIHDVLKKYNYTTNFIVSGAHTDFFGLKHHYGNNIDTYLEGSVFSDLSNANDEVLVENLESIKDADDQGSFFFFHLMSPHVFGEKLEEFQIHKPDIENYAVDLHNDTKPTNKNIIKWTNNYKNGILQSDHYIKEIFKLLEQKNYLNNSLVIITGDHGESLGENQLKLGHGVAIREHYTSIPILIYDTDSQSQQDIDFASQIDIAPFILNNLEIPPPKIWNGIKELSDTSNRILYQEQFNYRDKIQYYGLIFRDNMEIKQLVVEENTDTAVYVLNPDTSYIDLKISDSELEYYLDTLAKKIAHSKLE